MSISTFRCISLVQITLFLSLFLLDSEEMSLAPTLPDLLEMDQKVSELHQLMTRVFEAFHSGIIRPAVPAEGENDGHE